MNQQFTFDVSSFQKLLEAAWVLQCERDHELSESRMIHSHLIDSPLIESPPIESPVEAIVLAVPSDEDDPGEPLSVPAAVTSGNWPQLSETPSSIGECT